MSDQKARSKVDDQVMRIHEKLMEKADRAVDADGYLPYWSGYLAGVTDALLDVAHPVRDRDKTDE